MLIVISGDGPRPDEAAIINALFEEGLQLFHLRKPGASALQIQELLDQINPGCYPRIALHQQHQLSKVYGLRRLHFPERERKGAPAKEWLQLKGEGYTLSTSVHRLDDGVPEGFSYAFYGPLFDSISKAGYKSTLADQSNFFLPDAWKKSALVALGGIDESNCSKARQLGFESVAVLGAVWKAGDPVKQFKLIKEAWNSTVPLS